MRAAEETQIRETIQGINNMLQSFMDPKTQAHEESMTLDSVFTTFTSQEMDSFTPSLQTQGMNKDQIISFDKFIQNAIIRQQNEEKDCIQSSKPDKKIKFIQRSTTPKTLFNYHGIDIEVVFEKYTNCRATCLVIPYDTLDAQELRKLGFNNYAISSILNECDSKTVEFCEFNSLPLVINCYRLFKERNHQWLYLIKKPHYKHLPEYAADQLQRMVINVLQKCWSHKTTNSITFTGFQWRGLDASTRCEVFFWTIIMNIWSLMQTKKSNLKRITVCCQNLTSYLDFTKSLRQISDSYIKNGLIQI